MLAKAIQRSVRLSAKKANLVCALIRNQKVQEAFKILANTEQKTAQFLNKLLGSAVANAINNHGMNGADLYVFAAVANQGPTFKRTMPRAKGRSNLIRKRTTHLEVVVSDNLNERTELNVKLLKPRAHQHKVSSQTKPTEAIKVESQVINAKGAAK